MAWSGNVDVWTHFIHARYLKEARNYDARLCCPDCDSPKDCYNYYCLRCKVGELCPTSFREDCPHWLHPWIQVRRHAKQNVVVAKDLERFISHDIVKHIDKHSQNNGIVCYLKTRLPVGFSKSGRKTVRKLETHMIQSCVGCMFPLTPGSDDGRGGFQVCSLQCLTRVARLQPGLNLLRMIDGAMEPTPYPLTANEKGKGASTCTARIAAPTVAMRRMNLKRKRVSPSAAEVAGASLTRQSESPSSAELEVAEALCALQEGSPSSNDGPGNRSAWPLEDVTAADNLVAVRAEALALIDKRSTGRAGESIEGVDGCKESRNELPIGKVSRSRRVQRPSLKVMEMAAARLRC